MDCWKQAARCLVVASFAAAAGTSGAAQKAAEQKPAEQKAAQPEQAAPPAAKSMGYGVKLGAFFTDEHKQVAKRSFAQYFAKDKTCPKDMERQGKTCRAIVKGHYWAVGQPLQKAVETFPVPPDVEAKLPAAPQGYEYVRAGEDILLLSKAMHLVVDIIPDAIS